jgi:hypothetical protein
MSLPSRAMSEPAVRREVIGLFFRGVRAELDRRGLTGRVLERLQGEARELLEHPPLHGAWSPGTAYDQIVLAIARETNRQMVRDIGYHVAKSTTGPFVLPLVRTFLNLFGFSPLSLLNNVNRLASLQLRGVDFRYEPETERSGMLVVSTPEQMDLLVYAHWEGVLTFAKDIFTMPVTVGTAVLDPDGRSARVRVAW